MRILLTLWRDGCFGLVGAAHALRFTGSPQYYVGLAILVVLMVIALVKAFRMWEEIHEVEQPDSPIDLLEAFEDAHAAGQLDDKEFEQVRRRLMGTESDRHDRLGPNHRGADTSDDS